jgi:hypothetical protein
MVAPAWGTFKKPNDFQESEQQELENEYSQEVQGQIKDQNTPAGGKPQWGNFLTPTTFQGDPDPTEDEGIFSYLTRNITANASRIAEQIGGSYGNIEKFSKDILTSFPQSGGILGWAISELMGPERWERMIRGNPGQQQMLPTSEQLKEFSQKATGGYTKPKTSGEKKFQEFTEDVGALATGRTPANLIGRTLPRQVAQIATNKVLIPAAANVTKQVVNELGFGEDKANLAKMSVWLPLSLATNINAPAYASNLMNQGRNTIPTTVNANVPRFSQALDAVEATLLSSDPRTALARQTLNGIRQDLANGQTNVRSLMTMYDGVNAAKRNRGLFELGRGDQNFARRSIDRVRDVVRDEIMASSGNYPQAINDWQNGIRAWATIHRSNALKNWVQDVAQGPYAKFLSGPAAALFGVGSYAGIKAPLVAGTAGAALPAAYKSGQTLFRMWNNPVLADYYWRAIGAASAENLPAFLSNYQKLNKELEKSDSSNPKSKSEKK